MSIKFSNILKLNTEKFMLNNSLTKIEIIKELELILADKFR